MKEYSYEELVKLKENLQKSANEKLPHLLDELARVSSTERQQTEEIAKYAASQCNVDVYFYVNYLLEFFYIKQNLERKKK